MQAQKLTLPHNIITPLNFSRSPHILPSLPLLQYPSSNLSFRVNSKSGFFNSVKRMSKSQSVSGKNGGVVMISCGAKAGDSDDKDDGFYMRRCVELARKAIGCTSPNPMVGCVIVKDGKIVGEGFHPKAGQPHAEVFALRDAGDLTENATAYVSLEPCNHYGRTPPCSEALVKAKVKKVVVGMIDPNPIVASRGVQRLRDAGIDVVVGVEEESCKRLNEAFIHKMLTGKPFVTLRYSLSVNGHLLNQLGEGATDSGGYYSQLLQEYDAVILSASLIANSTFPASQEPGGPSYPVQIPPLTENAASRVIIFTDKEATEEPETAKKGIETVVLNHINLNRILEYCKTRGLCSVLVDLRGSFVELEALLNDGTEQILFQKIIVEVLPLWDESGGESSLTAFEKL
ncbi:CYTOSINE DEAMINASE FAMILY MEMBER [Salix viminalis]|uniref:Riboflavin biosynthesis protein PYRD, chloroplastic n=1 Tax=Salix viminalis TaxID=40686 RepID=A0A9Q0NSZ6_SALVM|nr:CYTOSINE DEAMINASE FAMILY MEMBER [Salix viminalis]